MSSTLEKGYNRWLREQNYRCVLCKERPNLLPSELQLRKHLLAAHANEVGDGQSSESSEKLASLLARARPMKSTPPGQQATAGPSSAAKIGGQPNSPQGRRQAEESEAAPPNKKARTPTNSNHGDPVPAPASAAPGPSEARRSRARSNPIQQQSELDFPRRTPGPAKHALWNEGQPGLSRKAANPSLIASPRPGKAAASPFSPRFGNAGPSRPGPGLGFDHEAPHPPAPLMPQFADYVSQPNTQPISSEQLVVEVKGIYAGLVMVESKCIEVDTSQNVHAEQPIRLTHEQWQALIALHRTLLHEHHDFFLASQHPSASAALRRLATKYAMPARMWRHGIHSFLELLRRRLPESLEHMLTFIYLAYGTMALLYETVPAFEETWIECLGDLGRYRMAIEEENQTDREVWTGVSRHWYAKASDKAPTTGRLYHHLAILARPNAVQQLYLYCKSLSVASPFPSAKESILTLFDPILSGALRGPSAADLSLVRAVGILFKGNMNDEFRIAKEAYVSTLDNWIHRQTKRWMEPGSFYALALCCAQLEFSYNDGILMQIVKHIDSGASGDAAAAALPSADFINALDITTDTDEITLKRFGDNNVLPYIHCRLAFLFYFSDYPAAMDHIKDRFPWKLLTLLLNFIMGSYSTYERVESTKLPLPAKGDVRPLPDDWALRGFPFSENVYPREFFKSEQFDDTEKLFELASMTEERKERLLWYGYQLATQGAATRKTCLSYDSETHLFSVAAQYDVDLETELSGSIASSPTATADDPEELPDADAGSAEAGADVTNMIAIQ